MTGDVPGVASGAAADDGAQHMGNWRPAQRSRPAPPDRMTGIGPTPRGGSEMHEEPDHQSTPATEAPRTPATPAPLRLGCRSRRSRGRDEVLTYRSATPAEPPRPRPAAGHPRSTPPDGHGRWMPCARPSQPTGVPWVSRCTRRSSGSEPGTAETQECTPRSGHATGNRRLPLRAIEGRGCRGPVQLVHTRTLIVGGFPSNIRCGLLSTGSREGSVVQPLGHALADRGGALLDRLIHVGVEGHRGRGHGGTVAAPWREGGA